MKVGLVYTVSTPAMRAYMEMRMHAILGEGTKCLLLSAPEVLGEVTRAGHITPRAARRLLGLYLQAMDAGCDAILNVCSSVSAFAEAMAPLNQYLGTPVVSIDAAMCAKAAQLQGAAGACGDAADSARIHRAKDCRLCAPLRQKSRHTANPHRRGALRAARSRRPYWPVYAPRQATPKPLSLYKRRWQAWQGKYKAPWGFRC